MNHECSGNEEYDFISGLVSLIRPSRVLEVGTAQGKGSLSLARAMTEGLLITVDIVDQRGHELLDYDGLVNIRFIIGNSDLIMEDYSRQGERFDLIFIDGGHHYHQVSADWRAAKRISDTLIFHDVLQFKGVARVIDLIRRDPLWDVAVLDYPGITLVDQQGEYYSSNRRPGMAIATRKKPVREPDLIGLFGRPSPTSRRATASWRKFFPLWTSASNPIDLGTADLEMLLHLLWERRPEMICQAGHVGTAATFLFQEYARRKRIPFLAWDVSGTFFTTKIASIPSELYDPLTTIQPIGPKGLRQVLEAMRLPASLLWIDAWEPQAFFRNTVPQLLEALNPQSLICLRSFSPHDGWPGVPVLADAQCSNPNTAVLCEYLRNNRFVCRLARPELVFDDYVNAGHWVYVCNNNSIIANDAI